jgi:hypothetical protein
MDNKLNRPGADNPSGQDSSETACMPDFMAANFVILSRRWPHLALKIEKAADTLPPFSLVEKGAQTLVIDGIHLTSAYDRSKEAQLQAAQIPLDSSQAWVYGMALGDIPRGLLSRNNLKELTIVVMNCAVAALSLFFFDHRDWLDDSRVRLVDASPSDRLQRPYAVAPACLQLASDRASRLRDLVHLELATPFIRKKHQANNPHLQKRLADNAGFLAQDPSIEPLLKSYKGSTIVVAGAGPTLTDHYGWLKSRKPGPLIAVDAAVKPLLEAGIIPDIVVAIDGHAEIFDLFFANLDRKLLNQSALVYFPVVQHETLSNWPGQRFAAYSNAPIFSDISKRYPKLQLFSSGSVIHPAVDLAARLSTHRVILVGADFSFPGGQSHVSGCTQARPVTGSHWVLNSLGERVPTIPSMRGFCRDLEDFLANNTAIRFYNAGPRGAAIQHADLLTEMP